MLTKQCTVCRKLGVGPKPVAEFNKNRRHKDGLQDKCRVHTREYCREWAKKNPEKNCIKGLRFRRTKPAAYKRIATRARLKNTYGLTEAQFHELYVGQKGQCAICKLGLISQLGTYQKTKKKVPNELARVDHCHSTNEVRGLLCFSCNVGLGKFRDDEDLLLEAIRYLRKSRNRVAESRQDHETVRSMKEPQVAGPQSSSRLLEDDHWLH